MRRHAAARGPSARGAPPRAGEIAVKSQPEELAPYALAVVERLVPVLSAPLGSMPRSIIENRRARGASPYARLGRAGFVPRRTALTDAACLVCTMLRAWRRVGGNGGERCGAARLGAAPHAPLQRPGAAAAHAPLRPGSEPSPATQAGPPRSARAAHAQALTRARARARSAITRGRVAWICPGALAPHLGHFCGAWSAALRSIRDDVEKVGRAGSRRRGFEEWGRAGGRPDALGSDYDRDACNCACSLGGAPVGHL